MESRFARHWIAVAIALYAAGAAIGTHAVVSSAADVPIKKYGGHSLWLPFSPKFPTSYTKRWTPSPASSSSRSLSSSSSSSSSLSSSSSSPPSSPSPSPSHQKKQPTDMYHGNGNHVVLNKNPEKKQNSSKPTRPTTTGNDLDERMGEKPSLSSQHALPKPTSNRVRPLHNETASTDKPKIETTTHDRSIIVAPKISCPDGQQMGPDRVCRPTFVQEDIE